MSSKQITAFFSTCANQDIEEPSSPHPSSRLNTPGPILIETCASHNSKNSDGRGTEISFLPCLHNNSGVKRGTLDIHSLNNYQVSRCRRLFWAFGLYNRVIVENKSKCCNFLVFPNLVQCYFEWNMAIDVGWWRASLAWLHVTVTALLKLQAGDRGTR